jgi:hypothetical protein
MNFVVLWLSFLIKAQPVIFTLEDAANNSAVRWLFLQRLRIPLAPGCIEEIAAINMNSTCES